MVLVVWRHRGLFLQDWDAARGGGLAMASLLWEIGGCVMRGELVVRSDRVHEG